MVVEQGVLTSKIKQWHYSGRATEEEPYAVTWIDNEHRKYAKILKILIYSQNLSCFKSKYPLEFFGTG
jgi:hypothetical protein